MISELSITIATNIGMVKEDGDMITTRPKLLGYLLGTCVLVLSLGMLACTTETSEIAEEEEGGDPVQLMTNMQYFLHKAGLSLRAGNMELADFYAHELEEMISELKTI